MQRKATPTFDEFDRVFAEELIKIPAQFKTGISKFIIEQDSKPHQSGAYLLYVLGEYQPSSYLKQPIVALYYGSFIRCFPDKNIEQMRQDIYNTITHELLHHWEHSSGVDELGKEDIKQLEQWKKQFLNKSDKDYKQLSETMFFLYLILLIVAFLARWAGINLFL